MIFCRHLSAKGARFVAGFEGFVGHPYNDPALNCTIGYGHLIHLGACNAGDLREWGTLTRDEALGLLAHDAERFAAGIRAELNILRQHRFDAFVSLAYNIGLGGFLSGRIPALQRARKYQAVADAFLLYDHANGKELPGLKARREAERHLYLTGEYVRGV